MARKDNLIPQAHVLTVDEQSMGGKASARKRAEWKSFAESCKVILSVKASELNKAKLQELGINDPDFQTIKEMGLAKIIEKYLKGDIQAFIALRDTIGEKPTNKTEITGALDQRIEINLIHGDCDPVSTEDDIT